MQQERGSIFETHLHYGRPDRSLAVTTTRLVLDREQFSLRVDTPQADIHHQPYISSVFLVSSSVRLMRLYTRFKFRVFSLEVDVFRASHKTFYTISVCFISFPERSSAHLVFWTRIVPILAVQSMRDVMCGHDSSSLPVI